MDTLRKAVIVVAVAVGVALVAGYENLPAQKPARSVESGMARLLVHDEDPILGSRSE
jgi:hypothetical protein